MTKAKWTTANIPDQHGRVALVTGANTGIGLQTAQELGQRGATVVLACRSLEKASTAAARILATAPGAGIATLRLDLASLDSVRAAAGEFHDRYPRLDLLINNAGLMIPPYRRTVDGFESQFGINHLGHFALTGLLLDRLIAPPAARIVTVSSHAHRRGRINFADLQSEGGYRPFPAYAQSKLANLMFTYELQRRLAEAGAETIAVAAHPGNAYTDLVRSTPPLLRVVMGPHLSWCYSWLIQSAPRGALPTLRAATDPGVRGGDYYGPDGWNEFTGHPVRVESTAESHNRAAQLRLWERSAQLTGVTYRFPQMAR
jgi:NAD(P)-dependent dehydrogenase (short-subunit alcohol dehydrogenase family)